MAPRNKCLQFQAKGSIDSHSKLKNITFMMISSRSPWPLTLKMGQGCLKLMQVCKAQWRFIIMHSLKHISSSSQWYGCVKVGCTLETHELFPLNFIPAKFTKCISSMIVSMHLTTVQRLNLIEKELNKQIQLCIFAFPIPL